MLRASAKGGMWNEGCWISFVQCTCRLVRGGKRTCLVTCRALSVKSQKALTVALVGQTGQYAAGECLFESLPAVFSRRILGSNEGTISMAFDELPFGSFQDYESHRFIRTLCSTPLAIHLLPDSTLVKCKLLPLKHIPIYTATLPRS